MNDKENNQEEFEVIDEHHLVRAGDVLPGIIHLLPVAVRPFFPGQVIPLLMESDHWLSTFDAAAESPHNVIGIVMAEAETAEQATPDQFKQIGTVARVHRVQQMENRLQVLVECVQRCRIDKFLTEDPPFTAQVHYFPEPSEVPDKEVKAYAMAIITPLRSCCP